MQHTSGPWSLGVGVLDGRIVAPSPGGGVVQIDTVEEWEENLSRAVACVNALDGIADPAAFVAAARAAGVVS